MKTSENSPLLAESGHQSVADIGHKKRSICETCFAYVLIFLFFFGLMLGDSITSQFVYKWVATNVRLPDSFYITRGNLTSNNSCGRNSTSAENEFQKISSEWLLYFSLFQYGLSLPVLSVLGVYSDFIGRKPIMLLSCLCTCIMYAIMVYLISKEFHIHYFFIALVISGFGGGHYSFIICFYASIADTTPCNNSRSINIALVEVLKGIAACGSRISAGYLIEDVGFLYISIIIATHFFIVTILVLFFFRETWNRKNLTHLKPMTFCIKMKRFGSFYTNSADRKHQALSRMILLLLAFFFCFQFASSRNSIEVLYQLRTPFCWTPEHVGYYSAIQGTTQQTIGTVFIKILQNCIPEEVIAVLGTLSATASCIVTAFGKNDWFLYTGAAVGIASLVPLPVVRAVLSKMVPEDKQGALFANVYIIEVISTLSGAMVFNTIYAQTQSTMAGMVFLVMAGFNCVTLTFLIMSIIVKLREKNVSADVKKLDESDGTHVQKSTTDASNIEKQQ